MKTFDQLLTTHSPAEMLSPDLTHPAKAIPAFIVMEPITHQDVTRVSVTARDENMRTLWQSIISESLLGASEPTPVGITAALRVMVREHLKNPKPRHEITDDPYTSIERCAVEIQKLIDIARQKTVGVKGKSKRTNERATAVADALWDCLRQLTLSLGAVGIKSSGEAEGEADE